MRVVTAFPSPASIEPEILTDEAHAPDELTLDERLVWLRLAPLAVEKGTLTKATAFAFVLLCRNIVLERRLAQSVQEAGSASHRGMIQRVDAELGDFALRAFGKPLVQKKKAATVNPFAALAAR